MDTAYTVELINDGYFTEYHTNSVHSSKSAAWSAYRAAITADVRVWDRAQLIKHVNGKHDSVVAEHRRRR